MITSVRPFHTSGSVCSIDIDRDNGILVKKVRHFNQGVENGHDKLLYEALEIRNSPVPQFYPRIIEIGCQNDELRVTMEYLYNGTTFADLLRNPLTPQDYINSSLTFVLDTLFTDFYIPTHQIPSGDLIRVSYIDRLLRRLETSLKILSSKRLTWNRYQRALFNGVCLNGQFYPSIYKYIQYFNSDVPLLQELSVLETYNSHHDLIPGNILVELSQTDSKISRFKLIDPRGQLETGADVRHFMYDLGKLMFGLDCYDLFRSSSREDFRNNYKLTCTPGGSVDEYTLLFDSKDEVIAHYRETQTFFASQREKLFAKICSTTEEARKHELQCLFAQAFMYHPDIPCRMIDECSEDMALCFHFRGLMLMRQFLDKVYGRDPLRDPNDTSSVELWPNI